MKLRIPVFLLLLHTGLIHATTTAQTLEAKVHQLKGLKYSQTMIGDTLASESSNCTYQGGGTLDLKGELQDQWIVEQVHCEDRIAILLSKQVAKSGRGATWLVVDTLLLPPVARQRDRKKPFQLVLYTAFEGLCSVRGRDGMDFIALLKWGKRERIDWRSGVEQAWTFDIAQERIVPLSTRDIRCKWDEP